MSHIAGLASRTGTSIARLPSDQEGTCDAPLSDFIEASTVQDFGGDPCFVGTSRRSRRPRNGECGHQAYRPQNGYRRSAKACSATQRGYPRRNETRVVGGIGYDQSARYFRTDARMVSRSSGTRERAIYSLRRMTQFQRAASPRPGIPREEIQTPRLRPRHCEPSRQPLVARGNPLHGHFLPPRRQSELRSVNHNGVVVADCTLPQAFRITGCRGTNGTFSPGAFQQHGVVPSRCGRLPPPRQCSSTCERRASIWLALR